MIFDRERDIKIIQAFIDWLANSAHTLSWQAGVGGMETAGSLISYLAEHPEDLEPFLNGGLIELPDDFFRRGCLTYHAPNGKVVHPQAVRFATIIEGLKGQSNGTKS